MKHGVRDGISDLGVPRLKSIWVGPRSNSEFIFGVISHCYRFDLGYSQFLFGSDSLITIVDVAAVVSFYCLTNYLCLPMCAGGRGFSKRVEFIDWVMFPISGEFVDLVSCGQTVSFPSFDTEELSCH
ncbi:transmembrane protein, putative [Medicago truncatula]|uniref:Transmembrane protein, putative n=1 Tax=Medicago truncatula TaxID=3880 RepID=A0A072V4M3_MEDTR|nr:transmembrane protein, putative [Medicago truncatula]